ncbi:MAG TPA: hypothetical protein VF746_10700 [Longimicrobium sp.]|jgi:hypothetical protein
MDPSPPTDLRDAVAALQRRSRRLSRCTALLAAGWLLTTATRALHPSSAEASAGGRTAAEVLRVRELVVVDAAGTPRVRIAAPLPDPIMMGRRFNRGDPVSGILIYDAEGNERGGYVTGDNSRGAALTLDEIMRAAIHLGVGDRGESHLTFSTGMGGYAALGVNAEQDAYLRLERGGRAVVRLPDATLADSAR